MDTSSVPLAYAPIAPLSPRPTQPREIFIGENQRHQRAVRTRRKRVSSPDVLSLSLALSLSFRSFASRVFQGIVSQKTIISFLLPSSLVHSSHSQRIGSLFLPIEPHPRRYCSAIIRSQDKVGPRGRETLLSITRACIKKHFSKPNDFLKQAAAIDRGNYRRGGGLVGTISFIFCIEDPRCIPRPTGYREWKPRKGEGERRIETKG